MDNTCPFCKGDQHDAPCAEMIVARQEFIDAWDKALNQARAAPPPALAVPMNLAERWSKKHWEVGGLAGMDDRIRDLNKLLDLPEDVRKAMSREDRIRYATLARVAAQVRDDLILMLTLARAEEEPTDRSTANMPIDFTIKPRFL